MVKEELVLENDKRRMLYNHILNYPGVTFNILKNIFEMSDSALRYHLDYLEKGEKIRSGVEKGLRCYFPKPGVAKITNGYKESSGPYELTPQQTQIIETIQNIPGIDQKELVSRTRINRFQVSKNIAKLIENNLVRKYRFEGRICYEYIPDEELKFKIIKRLVIKLLKNEIDEETFLRLVRSLD